MIKNYQLRSCCNNEIEINIINSGSVKQFYAFTEPELKLKLH